MKNDRSEIQVLSGLQAIRYRPFMYVGGKRGLDLLLSVLISLSDPKNEIKIPSKVHIQFLSDDSYRLTCDSALLPSGTTKYMGVEQPRIIPILLCLSAPGYSFLGHLPIINALSDHMKIVSTEDGFSMTVETSRGGLITPLSSTKSSEVTGSILKFLPDFSLFEVPERQSLGPEEILGQLPKGLKVPFELFCE